MRERKEVHVLVCDPERKTPLRRPRHRWEDMYEISVRKCDGKRLLRKSRHK
jgi:hypothetical protein